MCLVDALACWLELVGCAGLNCVLRLFCLVGFILMLWFVGLGLIWWFANADLFL